MIIYLIKYLEKNFKYVQFIYYSEYFYIIFLYYCLTLKTKFIIFYSHKQHDLKPFERF